MKGIILGSKRLDLIDPYLNSKKITYIGIELTPENSMTEERTSDIKYIREEEYVSELNSIMKTANIDFVLSNASTDHEAILNAHIAEHANSHDIPFFGHSLHTTLLFLNKTKTKSYLEQKNIKTPKYNYCSHKAQLLTSADEIGFPVIIKSIFDDSAKSYYIAQSKSDIEALVDYDKPKEYIVEKFLEGIEVSIKAFKSGAVFICLPPIFKGKTSLEGKHEEEKIKIFPYFCDNAILGKAKVLAAKIASTSSINGWLDIEAILVDNEFYVIEVKPRFTGGSRLIGMAMRINPYELMARTCLEDELIFNNLISGVSIEIPITNSFPEIIDEDVYCSIRSNAKSNKGFVTICSRNFDLLRNKLKLIGQDESLAHDIEKALIEMEGLNSETQYEVNEA